jgi:hypothetical protein
MHDRRHVPYFIAALMLLTASCNERTDAGADRRADRRADPTLAASVDDGFERALDAHGGLDTWRGFGTLEFELDSGGASERHVVDLRSRRVFIEGDGWRIGFDGQDVWVEPSLQAYRGNPMFYSSLHFYFFSLPFVLADPGTVHRSLGRQVIGDRTFAAHEVSFEDGVGGSSDDVYRLFLDPETNRLELLLYTATFFSGQPSDRWNAREYTWQDVDGLTVPASYMSRSWNPADSSLGEIRRTTTFRNVRFSEDRPDSTLFLAPAGAEIYEPGS